MAYVNQALQPFVDQHITSRFSATATRVDKQRIDTQIIIYKGPLPAIQLVYSILWDEQQAVTQIGHS